MEYSQELYGQTLGLLFSVGGGVEQGCSRITIQEL